MGWRKSEQKIQGVELICTCGACPEQYEAFIDGVQVGYLRLRHGQFTVDCPECGDEEILAAEPLGDGEFEDDERDYWLHVAVYEILRWVKYSRYLTETVRKSVR